MSIQAVMRPLTGTKSMAMRFQLLERTKGANTAVQVHYGDLGAWVPTPDPTLGQRPGDVWVLNKAVADLPAPATYRLSVTFRWTGADGKVLGTVQKTTASCYQPELRPDLAVQSIAIAPDPSHPRAAQYTVVVRNLGATAAGPFVLAFTPADGIGSKTRTVPRLGAHAKTTAVFQGRACTSTNAPTVVADSTQVVDDLSRANNTLTVPASCPASTHR